MKQKKICHLIIILLHLWCSRKFYPIRFMKTYINKVTCQNITVYLHKFHIECWKFVCRWVVYGLVRYRDLKIFRLLPKWISCGKLWKQYLLIFSCHSLPLMYKKGRNCFGHHPIEPFNCFKYHAVLTIFLATIDIFSWPIFKCTVT